MHCGAPLNADDGWLAELEQLEREGRELQSRSEGLERELSGLLAIGEHGAATVVLDAQGLIADLVIDEELREEVEADELLAEINQAHARAVREIASRAQPRWATESESGGPSASDVLSAPGIGQLLTSLATGVLPAPRETRNDLGTVTVTSMLGSIVTIDCELGWLGAASGSSIGEEIVRIARLAAIESDIFGRYAKSGVHDG